MALQGYRFLISSDILGKWSTKETCLKSGRGKKAEDPTCSTVLHSPAQVDTRQGCYVGQMKPVIRGQGKCSCLGQQARVPVLDTEPDERHDFTEVCSEMLSRRPPALPSTVLLTGILCSCSHAIFLQAAAFPANRVQDESSDGRPALTWGPGTPQSHRRGPGRWRSRRSSRQAGPRGSWAAAARRGCMSMQSCMWGIP